MVLSENCTTIRFFNSVRVAGSLTVALTPPQVRQAAFQSLGPFISTFANPSSAGLYIREDGTLSIRPSAQDVNANSCQPGNNITVMSPSANGALSR